MPESTPFRLTLPLRQVPFFGALLQPLASNLAGRMLALERLEHVYQKASAGKDAVEFVEFALQALGITAEVEQGDLNRIPQSGASIVVANHPYGGLEGLMLIGLLLRRRGDVKILANHLLWRIPELRPVLIPVDVLNSQSTSNIAGLRAAIAHVRSGGLLALFPAGTVSHLHFRDAQIVDPAWSPTAVRLIRKCAAPVTPMYFDGHNGTSFQLAGLIHPLLRTALLPREFTNKGSRTIAVRVGNALPAAKLQELPGDALSKVLRLATYGLAPDSSAARSAPIAARRQPVAAAIPAKLVAAELQSLPLEQVLLETNGLQVVHARAEQLPWALQELGRLRELTFRAAGEGTGHSSDVDLFDNYYTHLICWNPEKQELVGAYRIGAVDEILQRHGVRGLYTHTLFKYGPELPRRLGHALELGRSFVRPEYQRNFAPLLALWRGISEYVLKHPRYHVLFGPVSISNDYLPGSRVLLVEYLKRHCFDPQLSRLIKPRAPLRRRHPLAGLSTDLAQLSELDVLTELLTQLEPDGKGVPVLLRQYLKLGGKILGFNLDADFGNTIDGLIMVDLRRTDAKTLQRYMGREEAERYLARHRDAQDAAFIAGRAAV